MEKVKQILGILFIFAGMGALFAESFAFGYYILILGLIIFPPISDTIKEKFKIWQNRVVRYSAYIGLFFLASLFVDNIDPIELEQEEMNNPVRLINLNKVYLNANGKKIEPTLNDITYKVISVLDHKKKKAQIEKDNSENIHLLVEVSDYQKDILKKIAFEIKKDYALFAPNNCNINLWDNKEAYLSYIKQQEYYYQSYNKLMKESEKTRQPFRDKYAKMKKEWDKKYYPFIADHLLASITNGNVFQYYNLQNDYYKEVGGENYKK